MVSHKNYAESKGMGVINALGSVTINSKMVEYFKGKQEDWKSFGKMNSHLYRQQLFRRMEEKKLSPEAMMMVYTMASIIKSQPRIVQAMMDMPEEERFSSPGVWFAVRSFFETDCTQYVSQAKKNKKFPVVNIPNTMPGLDILWWCLCTEDSERTLDNLKIRPTFTQMKLKADVQTIAREGYEMFWTKIVKGTKNPDNVEAPAMRQDYYETQAADQYLFITLDKEDKMMELKAQSTDGKYTLKEVEEYLRSFDG